MGAFVHLVPLCFCILLSSLLSDAVIHKTLRVFQFNQGKVEIWYLSSDRAGENESYIFDFEDYGTCLRRFTLCYKVNHDVSSNFAIVSLLSTVSGKSA